MKGFIMKKKSISITTPSSTVSTIEVPKVAPTIDGYVSKIQIGGKTYALRCEVVEIYPITCPKCGASFELKYGSGQCPYCNTYYSTQFKLVEK
jgi:hypothetical protein